MRAWSCTQNALHCHSIALPTHGTHAPRNSTTHTKRRPGQRAMLARGAAAACIGVRSCLCTRLPHKAGLGLRAALSSTPSQEGVVKVLALAAARGGRRGLRIRKRARLRARRCHDAGMPSEWVGVRRLRGLVGRAGHRALRGVHIGVHGGLQRCAPGCERAGRLPRQDGRNSPRQRRSRPEGTARHHLGRPGGCKSHSS